MFESTIGYILKEDLCDKSMQLRLLERSMQLIRYREREKNEQIKIESLS